ncbi:hypothetical protein HZA71_00080 [Candidatus Falkowbacteria bacterium]|nr:hypothetical protein [Candidatus Falkowbacteria bacterium]
MSNPLNQLIFRISRSKELEEIIWTLQNYRFLRGWTSKIILPSFAQIFISKIKQSKDQPFSEKILRLSKEQPLDDKIIENLDKELSKVYDSKLYHKIRSEVEMRWSKVEKPFFKIVGGISQCQVRSTYYCYIGIYGGGGSFGRKNQIYVRVNPKEINDLKYVCYTIMHELIHLMIEKTADNQKWPHRQREGFVDKIIKTTELKKLL